MSQNKQIWAIGRFLIWPVCISTDIFRHLVELGTECVEKVSSQRSSSRINPRLMEKALARERVAVVTNTQGAAAAMQG